MITFLRLPRRPAGRQLSLLFGALLLFACLPARAEWFAATVEISGTTNNPVFKIINYSSREYDIQTVRIGIGNTAFNFDGANLRPSPHWARPGSPVSPALPTIGGTTSMWQ